MSTTKSTLSKTTINEIQFGEPADPTVANRPHQNLETNIDDILDYLKNDGAGSGMNSDMLDGQQGSYYRNASNLNAGTLPTAQFNDTSHGSRSGGSLHSAATQTTNGFMASTDKAKLDGIENGATADQTANEILSLIKQVDGSGSGLDSDYLDGQDSSYYTNIAARLGYTPVNKAGDTMGNPLAGPNAVSAGQYIPLGQAKSMFANIPSGTRMVFRQASVPTGWTQDTSVSDRVMRIVSGNGGGTGGSWTISGLEAAPHVLTINEMPSHSHGIQGSWMEDGGGRSFWGNNPSVYNATINTDSTGGNAGHSHNVTSTGVWRPAYIDVVVGIKKDNY